MRDMPKAAAPQVGVPAEAKHATRKAMFWAKLSLHYASAARGIWDGDTRSGFADAIHVETNRTRRDFVGLIGARFFGQQLLDNIAKTECSASGK